MFIKGGDEYQDIKIILGWDDDGCVWPIELQFLLQNVADAKE